MKLQVMHYSGDRIGGAARAAARLHAALRSTQDIDSRMLVVEKFGDDPYVSELGAGKLGRLQDFVKGAIDALPRRLARPADAMPRSTAWATRLTARKIDSDRSDIAHLHWINGAFLSIQEIGQIAKPVVWTLHDMWPFCGAEHLSPDTADSRWRAGYPPSPTIIGFDVDRWTWRRKERAWRHPMHIVAPSRWMAKCAHQSRLMRDFPVHIVPNTLDLAVYRPMDRQAARHLLGLPPDRRLVLFGAIKGTQLAYKGWDLLMPALCRVAQLCPSAEAVIFGQSLPDNPPTLQLPVHWMGHVHEDARLAALYSAADVLVIPSRQESFGQTGSEAQACGCPVVAFDATGLRDVVAHEETGLLAKAYDPITLAEAVASLLNRNEVRYAYGRAARKRAESLWSHTAVAAQYRAVYEAAFNR
jgi:glycosyltransferase involved in cell wall biosynthesis